MVDWETRETTDDEMISVLYNVRSLSFFLALCCKRLPSTVLAITFMPCWRSLQADQWPSNDAG